MYHQGRKDTLRKDADRLGFTEAPAIFLDLWLAERIS